VSQYSNHEMPDSMPCDDDVNLSEFEPDDYARWSQSFEDDVPAPLPRDFDLCPDGLHPFGSCDCPLPF
jgi:hypothetical protein